MANKKIAELAAIDSIVSGDYFVVGDTSASNDAKKATPAQVLAGIGATTQLNAAPDDHEYSGLYFTGTAAVALSRGDLCYCNSSSKYDLADADSASTMPCVAMVVDATISQDASGNFLALGFFRDDDGWEFSVGATLYVSTTAGAFTTTAPSGSGDQVQVVGYALTADIIFFNPNMVLVEVP